MAYNRQGVTSLLNYLNQEDTVQVGPTLQLTSDRVAIDL
eukprot:COSAG04_NODE_788_length_10303_cov_33.536946_3_plen_39_part_00